MEEADLCPSVNVNPPSLLVHTGEDGSLAAAAPLCQIAVGGRGGAAGSPGLPHPRMAPPLLLGGTQADHGGQRCQTAAKGAFPLQGDREDVRSVLCHGCVHQQGFVF